MKKVISLLLAIMLVVSAFPLGLFSETVQALEPESAVWDGTVADSFESGAGTESSPFIIKTAEQLAYLAQSTNSGNNYKGKYFKLDNDIVLNTEDAFSYDAFGFACDAAEDKTPNTWTPIGNSSNTFSGVFDGDGHKIIGIYINSQSSNQGFFGHCSNATVKNLGVTDGYIKGIGNIGGVVASNNSSNGTATVSNCYNNCAINCTGQANYNSSAVGGVVGFNGVYTGNNSISDCYNAGLVKSSFANAGGVVGYNYLQHNNNGESSISNCYNTGIVKSSADNAGGIVGYIDVHGEVNMGCPKSLRIYGCYNDGEVSGASKVGGIVGYHYATKAFEKGRNISYCYNNGIVSGSSSVGGIIGYVYHFEKSSTLTVNNCYNTGIINCSGSSSGGIVGCCESYSTSSTSDIKVEKCYNIGEINGKSTVGGIAGSNGVLNCCYNSGTVTGTQGSVGGVVGSFSAPCRNITNCYNSGTVSGTSYVGGVAGSFGNGRMDAYYKNSVNRCYNIGTVIGESNVGGVAGSCSAPGIGIAEVSNCYCLDGIKAVGYISKSSVSCTQLSNSEMRIKDKFAGFDFDTVWTMEGEATYPYPELVGLPHISNTVMKSFSVEVIDENDSVISEGYTVNWYEKGSDVIFGTGNKLYGADEEKEYQYEIILGEELCYQYKQPERQDAAFEEDEESVSIKLETISDAVVFGKITDIDSAPISGASIELKQQFGGKHSKTISLVSNENGEFSAQIANVPTEIKIAAEGYYTRTKTVIFDEASEDTIDLGNLIMSKLPENKITLKITKAAAAYPEDERLVSQLLSANGIAFEIYNQTNNKKIEDFIVQYPYLILGENEADANDVISVIATDENGESTAQEAVVQLDDQKTGECKIEFVENGKFSVGTVNGNESNIMMIFDSDGKFVSSSGVASDTVSSTLPEGDYSVVFIEKTDLLRSVSDISKLNELGLAENTDYALESVNIKNGEITEIASVNVPDFDENKLYYTVSANTFITANSVSATVGSYIIVRCEYKIAEKYSAENEAVSFVLPDSLNLVNESLTLDSKKASYTVNGNTVNIKTNKRSGIIRFYVFPTKTGKININAYLSFSNNGNDVTQPIGTASFTADAGSIKVPEKTGQERISVIGKTMANSTVTVYDNDTEVGTTTSNAVGSWSLSVKLVKPYSYSYHDIYAKVENSSFSKPVITDTKTVYFDESFVEVSKVTMIYNGRNYVFDFLNPGFTPSYSYVPGKSSFTFVVEFTGGDGTTFTDVYVETTDRSGESTYVPCKYDESKDAWIGTYNYSSNLPVGVNVIYNENLELEKTETIDQELIDDEIEQYKEEIEKAGIDFSTIYYVSVNRVGDKTVIDADPKVPDVPKVKVSYKSEKETVKTKDIPDYIKNLIDDGYQEFKNQNDTPVLTKGTDEGVEIIDFNNGESVDEHTDPESETVANKTLVDLQLDNGYSEDPVCLRDMFDATKWEAEDWADFVGLFVPLVGATNSAVGGIQSGITVGNIRKLLTSNYDDFNGYAISGIDLLKHRCPDGELALTKEQIDHYRYELFELTTEYSKKEKALLGLLDEYHWINTITGGVWSVLGARHASWVGLPGVADGVGFSYGKVCGYSYAQLRYMSVKLDSDMRIKLQKLKFEILQAYRCPPEGLKRFGRRSIPEPAPIKVTIDPSGYVYEAVPSNRLEGVKAEAYYYDYALDEFGVPEETKSEILWNAEEYDQVNPLYTDANGEYAWDVPFGQWLVKFSKDGYYDTDSRNDAAADEDGYLPVPPPQTEVNVAMVSKAAPAVEEINVYNEEIRIVFSQYMKPESVNTDTVSVTSNGSAVSGSIVPLNAEYDYEHENQYASRFAFVPDSELSGKVDVSVNNAENYAGRQMTTAYALSDNVAPKPQSIEANDEISVSYNSGVLLEVSVLPAEAGAGKSLEVSTSSPSIVGIVNENIVVDESGHANIMLSGNLPGESEITIALEGSDLTKTVKAKVSDVQPETERCEKVKANISSGKTVEKGTLLELSTQTEGAEIYYTLDGTCPCVVDSASRIKYTQPIELNEETFIIAYAVKDGMEESYTAGFTYFIKGEAVEDEHKLHIAAAPVEENRTEASCSQEGSYDMVVYCTLCDYEISRETITLPKKAHVFETDYGYDATCTNNGLTEGSHCQICGFVQTPQYTINATGHKWGEGVVTKKPTTTSEGVETYYCSVCNAMLGNKAIAKLPKSKNPLTVKAKTATIKYAKLKNKKQTVAVKSVLTVSKAKGKVSYEKKSGSKSITINKTTGKVTVKKGLKKGTYKIKVKVKASGDNNFKAGSKTVAFKIKVK